MTDVLLFHHALGVTPGIEAFADDLRAAGHTVATPDLFDGRTFDSVDDGVAYAEEVGFDEIIDRGVAFAAEQATPFAVIGFSLGVLPAQKLAQTHPEVSGAVLCHAAVPSSAFGEGWPSGVGLQIHISARDPWAADDLDAARQLADESSGELFVSSIDGHLVADSSAADHDPEERRLILERTLAFLDARR